MIELEAFKHELKKSVELIEFSLDVDVAFFDPKSRIVACTDEYIRQKGKSVHAPSIEEVIANENVVVNTPGHMPTCEGCRFLGDCPAKIELLKSIRKGQELFGVMAFTSFSDQGHDRISGNTEFFIDALNTYSDWIADMLFSKQQLSVFEETDNILNAFLEQSMESMLVINSSGSVIMCNSQAQNLFSFCDLYTRSAYHILPDPIVDKALDGNRVKNMPIKINGRQAFISTNPVFSHKELKYSVLSIFENLSESVGRLASPPLEQTDRRENIDTYLSNLLGKSRPILTIKSTIKKISKSLSTVLISGETGTGKGLLAKMIHQSSSRAGGPFVTLNCTSIPATLFESELFGYEEGAFTGAKKGGKPGRLELAQGGTLFLDEIGEMPLHMQVKLLNVLQDYEFQRVGGIAPISIDIRVIAATNQDLNLLMDEKKFRPDLFYRLNVIPIYLPPLRNRDGDIDIIAENFLDQANKKAGTRIKNISDPVMQMLRSHSWPGNIRELQNVIEYCINLEESEQVTPHSLPDRFLSLMTIESGGRSTAFENDIRKKVISTEASTILDCLDTHGHDVEGKKKTAVTLGISLRTLYRKLEKFKLISKA